MTLSAANVEEVQAAIGELAPGRRLLPVAARTKPALSTTGGGEVEILDVSRLRGIVEYDPAELTLTAAPATPVAELRSVLAAEGQYLPFDPPLSGAGATLGGTIAAGVSGPNAFRHGGVRDFIVGVRIIDGLGTSVAGGGKVVKNAAGFDLPKLMVGSMGRLGVIVEASLKVFPAPRSTLTLELELGAVEDAVRGAIRITGSPLELEALDILGDGSLLLRIGGSKNTLAPRADRIERAIGMGAARRWEGEEEAAIWAQAADLTWAGEDAVVRVALTLKRIPEFHAFARTIPGVRVRYSRGGAAAWIAWPAERSLEPLDRRLADLRLPALVLRGSPAGEPRLGHTPTGAFARAVARALDPNARFLEV
ncbi:MAG TPA: FAD-binding protein [Solirubrobacteraceae bacterium]|nr:FAD-binding protein [Solirubrobacteraceae bacterium]